MTTGFFGKMPASGDFVARGLGPRVRPLLDRWLTLHLAEHARTPEAWPEMGLHAVILGPEDALALAILPSHDTTGRHFPLAACCPVQQVDQSGIEDWAGTLRPALQEAQEGNAGPDALFIALQSLPNPVVSETPISPPLLWAQNAPTDPVQSLQMLFG